MVWDEPIDFALMEEGRQIIERLFDYVKNADHRGHTFRDVRDRIIELLPTLEDYHIDLIPEDIPYHRTPEERVIKEGELITLDCAVKHKGLWADRACTVSTGSLDKIRRELLLTAQGAFSTVKKESRPGASFREVITALNKEVDKGLCRVMPNCGGHGIGYELHQGAEYIYSEVDSTLVIPDHEAFTVEPVIYIEVAGQKLYAYFEDTILPEST